MYVHKIITCGRHCCSVQVLLLLTLTYFPIMTAVLLLFMSENLQMYVYTFLIILQCDLQWCLKVFEHLIVIPLTEKT